jgi:hypothetical protein
VQNLVEAKRLMDRPRPAPGHRGQRPAAHGARAAAEQATGHRAYGLVHAEHALPQLPDPLAFLVQEVYFFHRDLYDRLAEHL